MIFRRKILIILSLLFLQFSFNKIASVEPDEFLEDSKLELRARDISKNIRCMVCQNQSIDDSDSPLAKDLRILIRNEIKIGKSDKEIYKFLSDRYGDFILLNPPIKLKTLALWFLPFIFFLVGIYIIFNQNKKFKKQ